MTADEGNPFAEINRRNALYEPIIDWCVTLPTTDANRDLVAEFHLALDKIIRADFFDINDLRSVLIGSWWSDTAEPIVVEEIDGYCLLAWRRRREGARDGSARPLQNR
jgi:hypothetical protein